MIKNHIISALIGYLFGSLPTAFLILKKKLGLDIRSEGSGNVGTLNSYEVSNSKKIGFSVFIIDFLKGILSVLIVREFFGNQFPFLITALLASVLGHCYSIWLKFKGGRGLATAAGGMLVVSPIVVLIWLVCWIIIYKIKNDIHLANILASISVIIMVIFFNQILNNISFFPSNSNFIFSFSLSLLMLIILSKHWEPLKIILKKN